MSKKKRFSFRRLIAPLFVIVCVVILSLFFSNQRELIHDTPSIVTKQNEIEKNISIGDHTIDNPNIILNPYGNSPLTAIIAFRTDELVRPKIEIIGRDEKTSISFTFDISRAHILPVYGLYAGTENEVSISFGDIEKKIIIKTDPLPSDLALPLSVESHRELLDDKLFFFTPSSVGYMVAYDINGDVRWYLTQKAVWDISRLQNGHILVSTERLLNTPYYMTGLYEMDLLGKIHGEYSLPGGYHHDYYELENGNLLIASNNFDGVNNTVEDYIVEVDRFKGDIVRKFNLQDILPTVNTGNENWSSDDWFHNNSVWYDKDTNSILLSGRHADAVINIDYSTGDLRWILGDSTGWPDEYKHYFLTPKGDNFEWQWSQHAAMVTPEGYIFLFDNGNNKSKTASNYISAPDSYSRGVLYKVDDYEMTVEQVWQYGKERGASFYSPYISDVDYIDTNHYVVHSGGISYKDGVVQNQPAGIAKSDELLSDTVEIINGEVAFEMKIPTNFYRVEKMSLYRPGDKYGHIMGGAVRVGTLGVTEVSEEKTGLLRGQQIDADYEKHNITFDKQEDRLVFSGTFKENSNVRVVLVKGLEQKYYKMRITNKPHAALCIVVTDEKENESADEITVSRYINGDGLSGNYKIYVEIYDKIYDTGKTIKFEPII